jgi:hypothetical protein
MTHTGGENAASGFREQMTWQLRAARVLTDRALAVTEVPWSLRASS